MEDLKEIAVSIKQHHDQEVKHHIPNMAIGRAFLELHKNKSTYWLLNREYFRSSNSVRNIHGEVIGTAVGHPDTLTDDGPTVYKNTKLGEVIIKHFEGTHKYKVKEKTVSLTIYNRASYAIASGTKVINIKINIAGDKATHLYKSLNEIITDIKKLEREIDEEQEKTSRIKSEKEKAKQLELIKEKKKALDNAKAEKQLFIKKQLSLRNQYILDPQQEEIKRSNIFEGILVIDGGPGTGKTTALIQRIMFLKASSIKEYKPKLSNEQIEILTGNDSWIFFSPSELLRLYLKNNMTDEGLNASDDKVKVWKIYVNELCRRYKLFNSETRRPFLDLNKAGEFFNHSSSNIKKLSEEFDNFFFNYQKEKIQKVIRIDPENFSWKFTAIGIRESITKKDNIESWKDWIRLYRDLNDKFGDRTNDIVSQYQVLSDKIANEILLRIKKDPDLSKKVDELIEKILENSTNEILIDDDNEEEVIDFDESELSTQEKELELFKRLKSICRKNAILKYDKNVRLTKDEQELEKLMPNLETEFEYSKLGDLAYYIKYYRRIVSGSISNIFSEFPKIYKLFRKEKFEKFLTSEGKETLTGILKDRNSRIHYDEQVFLLYKINYAVKTLFSSDKNAYLNSNNSFINSFRDHTKSIIAIDEATDFSVLEIISMISLSNPLISSATLSGDLMQRMTKQGMRNWAELSEILNDIDVRTLDVSYRQSQTLLEIAKTIYVNELGGENNYRAYAEKNDNEPKPLAYFSPNENSKVNWIAERVIEIYNSYGHSIPTIAIFLSKDFEEFTKALNSSEILSDVGIKAVLCRDGQILGDENTIRVFPLEYIKGLEFEAVFFHNIDSLEESDILLRYFYVGLSRATFYLAVTGIKDFPKSLQKIKHLFHSGNWKN